MSLTRSGTISSLFIFLVISQVIILASIGYSIFNKQKVLGTSINPISPEDVIINPHKNLQNFYEPKPGTKFNFRNANFEADFGIGTINSDSLNERFDYETAKDDRTFRIMTLGDSYTFGYFVNTPGNYPEQLEDALNKSLKCNNISKFEVINLGVGGYDIEYSLHRFDLRGKKYNPDLLLWLLKDDDFEEITDYISFVGNKTYEKISSEKKLGSYRSKGIYINPGWYEAKNNLTSKLGIDGIVKYQTTKLQEINNLYNNKLVFLAFDYTKKEYKKILQELSRKRNNTFFYGDLPSLKKPEEAFPDLHPNVKGYTIITDHIYNYLISSDIIKCL